MVRILLVLLEHTLDSFQQSTDVPMQDRVDGCEQWHGNGIHRGCVMNVKTHAMKDLRIRCEMGFVTILVQVIRSSNQSCMCRRIAEAFVFFGRAPQPRAFRCGCLSREDK